MSKMAQVKFLSPIVNSEGQPYVVDEGFIKMASIEKEDVVLFSKQQCWDDAFTFKQLLGNDNIHYYEYIDNNSGESKKQVQFVKDNIYHRIINNNNAVFANEQVIAGNRYQLYIPFHVKWLSKGGGLGDERTFYCHEGSTWEEFCSWLNSREENVATMPNAAYKARSYGWFDDNFDKVYEMLPTNIYIFHTNKNVDIGTYVRYISGYDQNNPEKTYYNLDGFIGSNYMTNTNGPTFLKGIQKPTDIISPGETYFYAYSEYDKHGNPAGLVTELQKDEVTVI